MFGQVFGGQVSNLFKAECQNFENRIFQSIVGKIYMGISKINIEYFLLFIFYIYKFLQWQSPLKKKYLLPFQFIRYEKK